MKFSILFISPCACFICIGMTINHVRIERARIMTLSRLSEYRLPTVNVSFHMATDVHCSSFRTLLISVTALTQLFF